MVGTDPLGNPFKDVGTYFLDVYGWKVGQEDTKENYRAAQTCYGYGVSGNQSGKMFCVPGMVPSGASGSRFGRRPPRSRTPMGISNPPPR